MDKETDSAYAIRIEDWESANHHIINWFRNTSIPSIVDEFGNINIAKGILTCYYGNGAIKLVDLTKTHIQIYDVATKGLVINPWQQYHKTC